jgi:hypothetical protein
VRECLRWAISGHKFMIQLGIVPGPIRGGVQGIEGGFVVAWMGHKTNRQQGGLRDKRNAAATAFSAVVERLPSRQQVLLR